MKEIKDKRVKLSKEQKQKIIDLYNSGISTVKIGEMFEMKASNVAGYLKRGGVELRSNKQNSRKFELNHEYFDTINTSEKAYWLGFMYADGFIETKRPYVGISLALADECHIEKFKKAIDANYEIHRYIGTGYSEGKLYSKIIMSSEKMKSDLIKHGCIENKTNMISAPKIDKEMISHFIRGYIDGDGCITHSFNKYGSLDWKVKILGTDKLLDYIRDFIHKNNIAQINQYSKRKEYQIVSCLEFGGNIQVRNFLELIYKDATILLDRKYKEFLELKKYTDSRAC